jgi:hypothetical protein
MSTDGLSDFVRHGLAAPVFGGDSLRIARRNDFRKYMFVDESQQQNAGYRLRQNQLLSLNIQPKFRISRDAFIFTMGSCFARNVEGELIRKGFRVASESFELPREDYYNPEIHGSRTALNKYSVHSMYFEFFRVLETLTLPDDGFVRVPSDLWYDPHCSQVKPRPLEEARSLRQQVTATTDTVRNADFVFLTLGMTESWCDLELRVPINLPPKPEILRHLPQRFGFVNMAFAGVRLALDGLMQLVWKHCGHQVKFIITVSPVPIQTTFTDLDVIRANNYSKAVLRAAAEELAARYENVDYFPSYDILTLSPRNLVWSQDEVHVRSDAVSQVVSTFLSHYIEQ